MNKLSQRTQELLNNANEEIHDESKKDQGSQCASYMSHNTIRKFLFKIRIPRDKDLNDSKRSVITVRTKGINNESTKRRQTMIQRIKKLSLNLHKLKYGNTSLISIQTNGKSSLQP